MLSPSSSSASLHIPTSAPLGVSSPYIAPPTPPPPPSRRMPYYPPVSISDPLRRFFWAANQIQLPWYSFTQGLFPSKSPRRRRKKPVPQSSSVPVELPVRDDPLDNEVDLKEPHQDRQNTVVPDEPEPVTSILETPLTSHAPSEDDSTHPTTPSSVVAPVIPRPQANSTTKSPTRPNASSLPIVPAIPNFPVVPKAPKRPSVGTFSETTKPQEPVNQEHLDAAIEAKAQSSAVDTSGSPEPAIASNSPPAKPPPKSWADLVRTKAQPNSQNGSRTQDNITAQTNGFNIAKISSLAEALSSYKVDEIQDESKISFLEPRGLVNTGNMCYMNSVR